MHELAAIDGIPLLARSTSCDPRPSDTKKFIMVEQASMIVTAAALRGLLADSAAAGQELNDAIKDAQNADAGAQQSDRLLAVMRSFRDTLSVSHFKAKAMVEVTQFARAREARGAAVDVIPPRYASCTCRPTCRLILTSVHAQSILA
jgi:hypothetical protein